MSEIDPTGTKPGVVPSVEEVPKIDMKCRDSSCPSTQAIEMKIPGVPGQHLYQCVLCKRSWGISVGGPVDW